MRNPASLPVGLQRDDARAAPALSEFGRELHAGLSRRARSISPKFFYDVEGSTLFDRICDLPEYYPTRTELRILTERAGEIAAQIGPNAEIIARLVVNSTCSIFRMKVLD